MPKKVLQCLYSLGIGGAETMIINIDKSLDRDKVSFDYLINKEVPHSYKELVIERGSKVFCVPPLSESKSVNSYIKNIKNKILENGPYEAVHIHTDAMGYMTAIAAKKAGVKNIICHAHTTKYNGKITFKERISLYLHRLYLKCSNVICLACGDEAGKSVYNSHKFHIINNGICTDDFLRVNEKMINNVKEELCVTNKKIVLHIGRFDEAKNQIFIVKLAELFKDNEDVIFLLVGDGVLLNNVKNQANTDNIKFLGIRNDIPTLLLLSDVFIMPSIYEGIPVSLIEAQMAGIPCVVSLGVPNQVNQNVNVFKNIPLDLETWKRTINEMLEIKKVNIDYAIKIMREKGYDAKSNIELLMKYYGI